MNQHKGNDMTTEDSKPVDGFTESPKTAPLQDHIDSIFREFRKNVLINDDALAEMEATQQIIDIVHHRERIARLDELKYLLSLGEELYFPYGRSDKVISDRLAELNKEEHE